MKTLIPVLMFVLTTPARAEPATTLCRALDENAFPIQQVTLAWGEALPEEDDSPFFRKGSQKVNVTISGPRYYQSQEAVASHVYHSTRLGEQRSTTVKLGETDYVYLREYPELFPGEARGLKSASLLLQKGSAQEKTIQLDCE